MKATDNPQAINTTRTDNPQPVTPPATYIAVCRHAAHTESMALRAWAKAGRTPPRAVPVDYWDEWQRLQKRSSSSFRKVAA